MQSVVNYSSSPLCRGSSHEDSFPFSLEELPDEFLQSFLSSPTVSEEYKDFVDLDISPSYSFEANSNPVERDSIQTISNIEPEPAWHTPNASLPEELLEFASYSYASPASSTLTEPMKEDELQTLINEHFTPSFNEAPFAVGRFTHIPTPNKRRKTCHAYIEDDGMDDSFERSSPSVSHYSTGSSCSNADRKRLSNREAAHRYREKVKMRSAMLDKDLRSSLKAMNRAKQAYERALESFNLLQRVVQDLTHK